MEVVKGFVKINGKSKSGEVRNPISICRKSAGKDAKNGA